MSNTVRTSDTDYKVVELHFDHGTFTQGVKETILNLESLKKALALEGSATGIDNLAAGFRNLQLAGIGDNVDAINDKISALGAIGFSVLQNMTNQAIDFGQTLVGNVVRPILDGGLTRAMNIEQAKFQFRGLGLDVEKAMASAKAAVLGTAYGLDEAAKVASQLGASGMDVGEEMTSVLRGIAGVAAMTNSSFTDIGQIFTTVSGNGHLLSVQLMQLATRGLNASVAIAKYLGVTEDKVREMTTEGKISFDIFAKAMDAAFGAHAKSANETYEGSLRNVHAAMSRIGADIQTPRLEAMRDIFNALMPVLDDFRARIVPLTTAIGEFFKEQSGDTVSFLQNLDLSGLDVIVPPAVKTLQTALKAIYSLLGPIKDAFVQIFPAPTVKQILTVVNAILAFTQSLILTYREADRVQRTFAGIFAIFSIGWQIVKQVAQLLGRLFGILFQGSGVILDATANVGDFFVMIDTWLKTGTGLTTFFERLGDVLVKPIAFLKNLVGIIFSIIGAIAEGAQEIDAGILGRIEQRLQPMGRIGAVIAKIWASIGTVMDKVWDVIWPLAKMFERVFEALGKAVQHFVDTGDFDAVLDALNTVLFAGLLALIKSFMGNVLNFSVGTGIIANIKNTMIALTRTFYMMQAQLQANLILRIAIAIAILAAAVLTLSLVDSEGLTLALEAITVMLTQLLLAMTIVARVTSSEGWLKLPLIGAGLILFSIAIIAMTVAVKRMAQLDTGELIRGLTGVGALIAAIVLMARFLPPSPSLFSAGAGIAVLAVGIRLLVGAVSQLSGLSWPEMARGLVGVGALLGALGLFARFATVNSLGLFSGAGIVLLAVGINILVDALKKMGDMQWDEIWRGLTTLALSLAAVGLGLDMMRPSRVFSAAAVLIVATSLGMIADALSQMGGFEWGEIGRGLVALAGAIALIALALDTVPPSAIFSAAGIYIVATSLGMIARAVKAFGSMGVAEIAKGLITLAAALGIIALALHFMETALPGAAALLVATVALRVLAEVLATLGAMSWSEILTGLATLALGFAVIGGAAAILQPVIPAIMLLAGAIALLGLAIALIGAGIFLLGTGLTLISVAGVGASAAIAAFFGAVFSVIPMMVVTVGSAFITMFKILTEAVPVIVDFFLNLIVTIIDGLIKIMPKIIDLFKVLLDAIIQILTDSVPKLIETGLNLLLALLRGIRDHIGDVVRVGGDIIINLIKAMSEKQPEVINAAADAIIAFVRALAKTIKEKSPEMGAAGGELAVAIIQGMVTGLASGVNKVVEAAKNVAKSALNAAKDWLGISSPSKEFMKVGAFATAGMVLGLLSLVSQVEAAGTTVGNTALEAVQSTLSALSQSVNDNMDLNPTIKPVLDLTEVQKGASQIGNLLSVTPLSVAGTAAVADAAAAEKQANEDILAENDMVDESGTNISFTQNNYSPKAISAADNYRQTKSLIATAKEALPTK